MEVVSFFHTLGTILGVGGAIVSVVLMLRLRTDEQRLHRGRIARRISPVTWCGFTLLILSGVILTLGYEYRYNIIFGVKHFCVAILLVDALLIHFRYFPRYFQNIGTAEFDKTYATMRRIGTLSVICWVIVLIISMLVLGED